MNVLYVSRRYSEYESYIKSIHNVDLVQLVDHKLKCNQLINYYSNLSIIVMCESISDRRTQKEWLDTITGQIRNSSQKVCVLMFSSNPNKYIKEYNSISSDMIVYCMREYVEDEENKKNINQHLYRYLNNM